MNGPSRPVEAYRAIMDELAGETSQSVAARLVSTEGICSRARDDEELNAFVRSLSSEQRGLLVQMLDRERTGAIHDVLVILSWWVDVRNLGLTFRGEPMPVDLSGQGLHGDYVGRRQGWEWPEDPANSDEA